jgi:hypothetical protein
MDTLQAIIHIFCDSPHRLAGGYFCWRCQGFWCGA